MIVIACGPSKQLNNTSTSNKPIIKIFNNVFSDDKFVEICEFYSLPSDFNQWETVFFYNKQRTINKQWLYFKNEVNNTIYIIVFPKK